MRYYSYYEPVWDDHDEIVGEQTFTVSEDDIRRDYFPLWEERMIAKFGREVYESTYSFKECVEDWLLTNWAWEVKDDDVARDY